MDTIPEINNPKTKNTARTPFLFPHSSIRAILLLTACGNPSEACVLFRPLGETVNLMALLAVSREELETYRLGNKRQRRKKFGADRVRGMLKRERLTAPQNTRMYSMLSDYYLHPNALDHIFAYRTSLQGDGFVLPYFHRDLCISMFINLVSAADTALLFWVGVQEDDSDVELAHALKTGHTRHCAPSPKIWLRTRQSAHFTLALV